MGIKSELTKFPRNCFNNAVSILIECQLYNLLKCILTLQIKFIFKTKKIVIVQ